jgi:hypothetical protein
VVDAWTDYKEKTRHDAGLTPFSTWRGAGGKVEAPPKPLIPMLSDFNIGKILQIHYKVIKGHMNCVLLS